MRKPLLFLTALALGGALQAQWTENTEENTLVAVGETSDLYAAASGDGHTYVVFWEVLDPPTYHNLRLQIFDADGIRLLGNDGIVVSETIDMSSFTTVSRISTDPQGNLYIGVNGSGDNNGYVFKMDTQANHLWPSQGIIIPGAHNITALPLSDGQALISWFSVDGMARMQKFTAAGSPVWPAPVEISEPTLSSSPENMFELSNGDFMVIYHGIGFGINSTLYARRFDSTGEPVWDESLQLSTTSTAFINRYSSLQDGDVVYIGYSGSVGFRFDSFLQRIDPDGSLPWGPDGVDFDTAQGDYEIYTEIAMEPGSDYIYSICSYSNTLQDKYGEYVQKFDKTSGERQFGDNAKQLYAPDFNYHKHASPLYVVEDHPYFLLKVGEDNGILPTTLEAVILDSEGNLPESNIPVASFSAPKTRTTLTAPVGPLAVAIFAEDKGDGIRAYAQALTEEITALEETPLALGLRAYPNPTADITTLVFSATESFNGHVEVLNIQGKVLHSDQHRFGSGTNKVQIDLGDLPAGMYFYRLRGGDMSHTGKVMRK